MRQPSGKNVIRLLASIVVTLFPERYRSRFGLATTGGAVTGGALQLLGGVALLIFRYVQFSNQRLFATPNHVMVRAAEQGGDTAVMGMGVLLLAEYMIQPLTLLITYFSFEGLVRGAAGYITGEIVPTLPLLLISLVHGRAAKAKYERDLGPSVEDLVSPGAGEFALCIATCRPKPWTKLSTISYRDQLYELAREEQAQPPRPWVYVLRRRPEGKVIRGEIHQYSPDELVPKKAAKTATS